LAIYSAMAFAVLAKGPVGVLLPSVVIGFFLYAFAVVHRPRFVVCVAVIALPWYVTVGLKTNGAWLEGFLGQHNLGRFLKPMEGHHGPVLYYPIAMLIGFFPWSVFCLPVIRGVIGRLKRAIIRGCCLSCAGSRCTWCSSPVPAPNCPTMFCPVIRRLPC
jgi:4-amino-4-deoxy-L-arabinose transferase-like glycosyltransferase